MNTLLHQFVNLLGAMLLMLAFAMISQRRVMSLIQLFTMQGAILVLSTGSSAMSRISTTSTCRRR